MNTLGKILILEDDASLRTMLGEILEEEGYSVHTCADGESAVGLAESETFDLVILDVRMPGIDGLEALAMMHDSLQEATALVITGYASEDDTIRALRLGVADYLKKPFDLAQFLRKVEELIDATQQRRARLQREKQLSSLACWSSSGLMRSYPTHSLDNVQRNKVEQTVALAHRLGEMLGIFTPELEHLALAAAILCLKHIQYIAETSLDIGEPIILEGNTQNNIHDINSASTRFSIIPDYIRQALGEPQTLPGCIIRTSVATVLNSSPLPPLPPRYASLLRQALDIAVAEDAYAVKISDNKRAAFNLGWALLRSGNCDDARRVFSRSLQCHSASQKIEAHLYLAETARLSHRYGDIRQELEEAIKWAHTVGPVSYAQTLLSSAICLIRAGQSDNSSWLDSSRKLFAQMQLETECARATLALATQTALPHTDIIAALQCWQEHNNLPQLCADLEWWAPTLLTLCSENQPVSNNPDNDDQSPGIEVPGHAYHKCLQRLLKAYPRYFRDLLNSGTLPQRQYLLLHTQLQKTSQSSAKLPRFQTGEEQSITCRDGEQHYCAVQLPTLQVISLGQDTLILDGKVIEDSEWHTAKSKYLLLYLLSHPGGCSEDAIIEEFWPKNWETGKQNLYSATSRLRRVLKRCYGAEEEFIKRNDGKLQWPSDLPLWFDLHELRRTAAQNATANALSAWHRAAELCQGIFLPNCAMNWVISIRRECEQLLGDSLFKLGQHYLNQGRSEESLEYAQRSLELNDLDQKSCILALQSLLNLRQHERALHLYRRFSDNLRRELQTEPNLEIMRLYQQAKLGICP